MNSNEKLPERLERAFTLVLEKPDELYIQRDMRELLRRGFLEIGFGTGLSLSELGSEYLASYQKLH